MIKFALTLAAFGIAAFGLFVYNVVSFMAASGF